VPQFGNPMPHCGLGLIRVTAPSPGTGYTLTMRVQNLPVTTLVLLSVVAVGAGAAVADDKSAVTSPAGDPVQWEEYVAENGPLAVLLWASWAPRNEGGGGSFDDLADAASSHGLKLVIVDVQEPLEDARKALEPSSHRWLHDRHGSLMKSFRVVRVPTVVVLTAEGEVAARLQPTANAIREWKPR
jgi:hypothetical protein